MTEKMHIKGLCPFTFCVETKPHDHEICPECGAVNYGNVGCATCYSQRERQLEEFRALQAELEKVQ